MRGVEGSRLDFLEILRRIWQMLANVKGRLVWAKLDKMWLEREVKGGIFWAVHVIGSVFKFGTFEVKKLRVAKSIL